MLCFFTIHDPPEEKLKEFSLVFVQGKRRILSRTSPNPYAFLLSLRQV